MGHSAHRQLHMSPNGKSRRRTRLRHQSWITPVVGVLEQLFGLEQDMHRAEHDYEKKERRQPSKRVHQVEKASNEAD